MNNNEAQQAQVRRQVAHDDISRRAEELWRQYGTPHGRDEEIWLEAERQLRGQRLDPPARAQMAPGSANVGTSQPQLGVRPTQGAPGTLSNQPSNTEFMEKPKPDPAKKARGKSKK